MARGPKKPKYRGILRTIVARNVQERMESIFMDSNNKPFELHKKSGVSLSTVQRVLAGDVGATIDTLEQLSAALACSALDLMTATAEVKQALGVSPKTPFPRTEPLSVHEPNSTYSVGGSGVSVKQRR